MTSEDTPKSGTRDTLTGTRWSRVPCPGFFLESDRHSDPHERLLERCFKAVHLAIDALEAVIAGEPIASVGGTGREQEPQLERQARRALAGELGAGEVIAAQPHGRSGTDLPDVAHADPSRAHLLGGERRIDSALDHAHFRGDARRDGVADARVELRRLERLEPGVLGIIADA